MKKTLLDVIKTYGSICWYPQSGFKFSVLLYLNDKYDKSVDTPWPHLLIMNSYRSLGTILRKITEEKNMILYEREGTKITVDSIEELEKLETILDKSLGEYEGLEEEYYNRVIKFNVTISSLINEESKEWKREFVYVCAGSITFLESFLLAKEVKVGLVVS